MNLERSGVRKVGVRVIEEVSINNKTLIVYVRPSLTSIRTSLLVNAVPLKSFLFVPRNEAGNRCNRRKS